MLKGNFMFEGPGSEIGNLRNQIYIANRLAETKLPHESTWSRAPRFLVVHRCSLDF